MRHWFDGVELTQSFSFNPHKWLLTNFDCAALWVADSGPLKTALSLTPSFLQAKGNALDYKVPACWVILFTDACMVIGVLILIMPQCF